MNRYLEKELINFKKTKLQLLQEIKSRLNSSQIDDFYNEDSYRRNYKKHFENYTSPRSENPIIILDNYFSDFIDLNLNDILKRLRTFLESLSNLATGKLKEMADVAKEVLDLLELIDK